MKSFAGGLWPPGEATSREALGTQPEALTIVAEQLQSGASSVAKQKDGTGEWILVKFVTAECGEPINALTEIDRLISQHDLELRR